MLQKDSPLWDQAKRILQPWSIQREKLALELEPQTKKHLILVKYPATHNAEVQWINNKADIDNARVVWAYSMGDEKDCELIRYFPDRKIWFLQVKNTINGSIVPYSTNICN